MIMRNVPVFVSCARQIWALTGVQARSSRPMYMHCACGVGWLTLSDGGLAGAVQRTHAGYLLHIQIAGLSQNRRAGARRRASAFGRALAAHLAKIRSEPGAYGQLGLSDLFEMREECLREFGFADVYRCVPPAGPTFIAMVSVSSSEGWSTPAEALWKGLIDDAAHVAFTPVHFPALAKQEAWQCSLWVITIIQGYSTVDTDCAGDEDAVNPEQV